MKIALEVIDSLIKKYNIDTNRLYVYGTSMGGYGTFDVLYRQPGRFAAAMVLCGGGNPDTAPEVMKTPLWIFHGSADPSVNISESRNIYNRMIASGAKNVRFTEYPGVGHNTWDYAPNDLSWPDWIFNFSKNDTFNQKPDGKIIAEYRLRTDNKSFEILWNKINNKQDRKNKIWYHKVIRNGTVISTTNFAATIYTDRSPGTGLNSYKIIAVNYDFVESDTSNTVQAQLPTRINGEEGLPSVINLSQNYPNPFNPSTVIDYQLSVAGNVKLSVYDLLGQEIKTLVDSYQSAGGHSIFWNVMNDNNIHVNSGVFFYSLTSNKQSIRKKMILMR
jgi:hypothetical protein